MFDKGELDINKRFFIYDKKHLTSISHIKMPRLNWDDRRIDYHVDVNEENLDQEISADAQT